MCGNEASREVSSLWKLAQLFPKRNELVSYREDVDDEKVQSATQAPEISLIFKKDIFIFYLPP